MAGKFIHSLLLSFFFHALLLGMVALVFCQDSRNRVQTLPDTLENISVADHDRKLTVSAPRDSNVSGEKTEVVPVENSGVPAAEIQKYLLDVISRINRVKQYPKEARINEEEGTVDILLEVAPDGKVIRAEVEKPSSHDILNRAAMAAIGKIGSLPALPSQASGPIKLHIPIRFQLK